MQADCWSGVAPGMAAQEGTKDAGCAQNGEKQTEEAPTLPQAANLRRAFGNLNTLFNAKILWSVKWQAEMDWEGA